MALGDILGGLSVHEESPAPAVLRSCMIDPRIMRADAIRGVPTSMTAFLGRAPTGPMDEPTLVLSWPEYERLFGGLQADLPLGYAVRDFFANGGQNALVVRGRDNTGLRALDGADVFNLLCIPPDVRGGDAPARLIDEALAYAAARHAFLLVDPPASWKTANDAIAAARSGFLARPGAASAALYFPRVLVADPLRGGQVDSFVPCGAVAGVIARTDERRGVWKAPAGIDAKLTGVEGLAVNVTDAENDLLNPLGVNCLRSFAPHGLLVWGARTMAAADPLAPEWKFVPVRRTASYLEASIHRGTQWAVSEPNGEPLWAQIRSAVEAFMLGLFRSGGLQGSTPDEAFFVRCDATTTTQPDVDRGVFNILVGFAPLRPAEFVVLRITQMAGQQPPSPSRSSGA
jgi:Bacteriophage tail sheath protein